jgi:hypothetical protein
MHRCLVRGYPNLEAPRYDRHDCPTFSVCPGCGTRSRNAATRPPAGWESSTQLLVAAGAG